MASIVAVLGFFLVAVVVGLTVMKMFKVKLGVIEMVAAGLVVGSGGLSLILFWQSLMVPFSGEMVRLSLGLILLSCGWWWRKKGWLKKIRLWSGWKKVVKKPEWWTGVMWLVFWASLMVMVWGKMLVRESDGLYAGWINVWGDWAAHLSYVTSFAYGDNLPPQMPIMAGERFSYPFLADWLSAVLIRLGAELIPALLWSSVVLSVALVIMVFSLGKTVSKKIKVGWLTSYLFLFNGGLGWWWMIKDGQNLGWKSLLIDLPREYTHLAEPINIQWINVITSSLIPQRGFLLGFPLAVLIYVLLFNYWSERKRSHLQLAGWLTVLLPLIHAHSFVLVGMVGGWLALTQIVKNWRKKQDLRKVLSNWTQFFLPMVLVGLPQVGYFYSRSLTQEGFVRLMLGWMAEGGVGGWIWFWVKNLGVMAGLIMLGWWMIPKITKSYMLGFWGLFVLANGWLWQPWEWDNTKILIHWYVMAAVLGAVAVVRLIESKKAWWRLVGVGLFGLSIVSGLLDVGRLGQYRQRRLRFFDPIQLELAEWTKENTEPGAVFLTADNHDHWVPVLTGRKILLGFKGWLWTYGIDYGQREKEVRVMFAGGDEAIELLDQHGVNYVVIGPMEKSSKAIKVDEEFFRQRFSVVYQQRSTTIFQVN